MKLKARSYDVDLSEPSVILHDADCVQIGVRENDRVRIEGKDSWIALVDKSDSILKKGEVLIAETQMEKYGIKDGEVLEVVYSPKPDSVNFIRRKMDGEKLSKDEIRRCTSTAWTWRR